MNCDDETLDFISAENLARLAKNKAATTILPWIRSGPPGRQLERDNGVKPQHGRRCEKLASPLCSVVTLQAGRKNVIGQFTCHVVYKIPKATFCHLVLIYLQHKAVGLIFGRVSREVEDRD